MNEAPHFSPYPLAQRPVYSRWWISGAALLSIVIMGDKSWLRDFYPPRVIIVGMVLVMWLWLIVFLLRVLFFRFNRHNAELYNETAREILHEWWTYHRQTAALVESALVGVVGSTLESRRNLFLPNHLSPFAETIDDGLVLRLRRVTSDDIAKRERQLAVVLAMQWREQHEKPIVLRPLRCYWQGSASAWQAFAQQMATSCPQIKLPEHSEPWQGIASLGAIIDQLQGAPADARILCAGCQSTPPSAGSLLPAGEAALLWLLGPSGGVRFTRGEWFDAEYEDLPQVAERALKQGTVEDKRPVCVSFSQPGSADLSTLGWDIRPFIQDANFGDLAGLQGMVAQTLAAAYVEQHGVPCAWLADDPQYTLTLGVVKPDDSRT